MFIRFMEMAIVLFLAYRIFKWAVHSWINAGINSKMNKIEDTEQKFELVQQFKEEHDTKEFERMRKTINRFLDEK